MAKRVKLVNVSWKEKNQMAENWTKDAREIKVKAGKTLMALNADRGNWWFLRKEGMDQKMNRVILEKEKMPAKLKYK